REVETRLKKALELDRARVQVGRISRFGLMEMSRQRLRPSLDETSSHVCPRCNGTGVVRDTQSVGLSILRLIEEEAAKDNTGQVRAIVPVVIASFLLNEKRDLIAAIEQRNKCRVVVLPNPHMDTPNFEVQRLRPDDSLIDEVSYEHRFDDDKSDSLVEEMAVEPLRQQQAAVSTISRVAPIATPVKAVEASTGLWSKLAKTVSALFVGDDDKPAPAPKRAVTVEKTTTNNRNDSNRKPASGRDRNDRNAKSADGRRNSSRNDSRSDARNDSRNDKSTAERKPRQNSDSRAPAEERKPRGRNNRDDRNSKNNSAQNDIKSHDSKSNDSKSQDSSNENPNAKRAPRRDRSRRPVRNESNSKVTANETVSTEKDNVSVPAEIAAEAQSAKVENNSADTANSQNNQSEQDNNRNDGNSRRRSRRQRAPRNEISASEAVAAQMAANAAKEAADHEINKISASATIENSGDHIPSPTPSEVPVESPTEAPAPVEVPTEAPQPVPQEAPAQTPEEIPADTSSNSAPKARKGARDRKTSSRSKVAQETKAEASEESVTTSAETSVSQSIDSSHSESSTNEAPTSEVKAESAVQESVAKTLAEQSESVAEVAQEDLIDQANKVVADTEAQADVVSKAADSVLSTEDPVNTDSVDTHTEKNDEPAASKNDDQASTETSGRRRRRNTSGRAPNDPRNMQGNTESASSDSQTLN
ncbi:MAG: ribonuclease E/G, partial [Oleibacter sp.]|nr:ribonuclease E/G [Thalassolituus sp.]